MFVPTLLAKQSPTEYSRLIVMLTPQNQFRMFPKITFVLIFIYIVLVTTNDSLQDPNSDTLVFYKPSGTNPDDV